MGTTRAYAAPGDKPPTGTYVPLAEKGAASGVATLDASSKIPTAQLPNLSATFVSKGDLGVHVKDYGAIGDGITNDTNAILSAATAAAAIGAPVVFRRERYRISALEVPANTTFLTNGCTFVKTENNSTYALRTGDNFRADSISLEIAGGVSNDAGVFINGSNTAIRDVRVVSRTADQPGTNALLLGDLNTPRSNIQIDRITITGFRSPMRVINVSGSSLSNATINNFMTGVYIINCTDSTFDKFNVSGTSPSSTGTAGQNGCLLEAQNADYGCINLRFRDWVVDGAPEHSYRVGGGMTVADITFDDCISRNPGSAPGNVATGGSAFKVLGAVGHMHNNVRLVNPTAEDGNVSASGINNHAQYHFGLIDGLTVINPTTRAKNKTYSGQIGILLFASKNVEIVAPNIKDTNRQSLLLFKDITEPSPPIGLSNIRIVGGLLDTLNRNNVIAMDTQSAVIKDVFIEGVVASRGASALRVEVPKTVGSDIGAYTNVNVKLRYINAPTASTTPPITGGNLTVVDYTGPIYGSSSIPSRDGGTYLNEADGKRYIRKVGAWIQQ